MDWLAALALVVAVAAAGRPPPGARLVAWRALATSDDLGAVDGPGLVDGTAGPGGRLLAAANGDRGLWLLAAALGLVVLLTRVPPVAVLGLIVAADLVRRTRRRQAAARHRERCTTATVEVTFALAGELRAGRTPQQALAAVAAVAGPLRPALDSARAAVGVGADAAIELGRAAVIPGAERLSYVAATWAVADSAGGRVADVLERLGEAMDHDDELRQELDAAMAGPRATIVLLAGLPALGLLLGQSVGARPLHFLLHKPLGWALLVAALILDGLGVLATRAIARFALRS